MQLHAGHSADGINWVLNPDRIEFIAHAIALKKSVPFNTDMIPRVVWIEDRYYITWCNGYHGPTIGVGYNNTILKRFTRWKTRFCPLIAMVCCFTQDQRRICHGQSS